MKEGDFSLGFVLITKHMYSIMLIERESPFFKPSFGGLAMGASIEKLPFREFLEQEIQEWRKFRRALRKEDQQFLDQFFEKAKLHVEAGGSAGRLWPFETILISMFLEQEKELG